MRSELYSQYEDSCFDSRRGVFEKVERLAKKAHRSRSEVFSTALKEYVARHAPDEVTEAMNRVVCDEIGDASDGFVSAASRRVLENSEW